MPKGPIAAAETVSYPCGVHVTRIVQVAPRTYGIQLASFAAGPTDALVTMFTHTRSYSLSLPAQAFTKRLELRFAMLAAAPIFFTIADDDPIEAAYADVPATSDSGVALPCIVSRLIVADALRPKVPGADWPNAFERTARAAIVQAFKTGAKVTAVANLRGDEPAPACAQPYQPARSVTHGDMDLREAARTSLGTGGVEIEVILDPQGRIEYTRVLGSSGSSSFDGEMKRTAERGSYAPEIFRCEPVRSIYRLATVTRTMRR